MQYTSVFHSFLLLTCIPLYRLPHVLYPFASCGHLGYFQFLAIVSNAAMRTHLKVLCVHMFPFLLGRCLEVILLVGMSLEIKGMTSHLPSAPMHSALQPHSWSFFRFSDSRVGGPLDALFCSRSWFSQSNLCPLQVVRREASASHHPCASLTRGRPPSHSGSAVVPECQSHFCAI